MRRLRNNLSFRNRTVLSIGDADERTAVVDEPFPTPPTIQSAQPDLIIRVGEERTTYNYYKVIMAHHSKYIDDLLFSATNNATNLGEISFPDIQPGVWELMVSCLRPANTFTVTSAYLVFPFYTKYEFEEGLRLCDKKIQAEIERTDDLPINTTEGHDCTDRDAYTRFLDTRIRYLVDFADLLPRSREAGIAVLEAVLHDRLSRLFLTHQHFKTLLPLLLKEERLLDPVRLVLADVGVTVPDIVLAEEHDNVNTIYQLLKLQFKLDYARSQGCEFPDEQQQEEEPVENDDDNFSARAAARLTARNHPSNVMEDDSKGSFSMFRSTRSKSSTAHQQHESTETSYHNGNFVI